MKTLLELEQLRSDAIDRLHEEGTKLTGWTSEQIALINAKAYKEEDNAWSDDWRILKANAALLSALGGLISVLDKMIKERTKKTPAKDAAIDALEAIRGR